MIRGYVRVSSKGQALYGNSIKEQERELVKKGASVIYKDVYTGTTSDKPELERLMSEIEEGDTLLVTKLDRISRSITQGVELIRELKDKGVKVHILNMGLVDDSPLGNLMIHIMLAFAQYERDIIYERTREGIEAAKLKDPNFRVGAKEKELDQQLYDYCKKEVARKAMTVVEACDKLGISRKTWYNRLKKERNR